MRGVCLVSLLAVTLAGCAPGVRTGSRALQHPDRRTVLHVLNRLTYTGPRPGDADRVQAMGLATYIAEQLHPEQIDDARLDARLAPLTGLGIGSKTFATDFYLPMVAARQLFTDTQKTGGTAALPRLGWHLLPIAAMSLPGGDKPVIVLQQAAVTPEELRFQRRNQQVMQELQTAKLLRAVYSERQLEEVLVDFWFNHFNVFAGKLEDKPVVLEYERDVIRPRVFGRFRDLLGAVAKSPAMLFYLDNWLSRAGKPNENYARELMELHTLGVDGGYTQHDVVDVARAFTGWTLRGRARRSASSSTEDARSRREARARPRAQGGARHRRRGRGARPSRAPSVDRPVHRHEARAAVRRGRSAAGARRARGAHVPRTDGNLREVVRTILPSPEFQPGGASREAEDAVRIRRERVARDGRRSASGELGARHDRVARRAALSVPAADRLRRSRGLVDGDGRADRPAEFRAEPPPPTALDAAVARRPARRPTS